MLKGVTTAISVLQSGGVVVFPTETAYAMGCDARDSHAVETIVQIKGRDVWKTPPLIAVDLGMVERYAILTDVTRDLARRFWPGPLTLIVPVRSDSNVGTRAPTTLRVASEWLSVKDAPTILSPYVIRDGTIAIRVSSDSTARTLSRAMNAPIVATSANVSGEANCYRIEDVRAQLGTQLPQPDFFIDGGSLEVRPVSTIVKEEDGKIVVLRQGSIDVCNEQKNLLGKIG